MDGDRFDELTRRLATNTSRRAALKGAAVALLGALGPRVDAEAAPHAARAQCGNTSCRNNPGKCNDGCVCCVHGNGNSRCVPPGSCGSGTVICPEGESPDPVLGCVPEGCPRFTVDVDGECLDPCPRAGCAGNRTCTTCGARPDGATFCLDVVDSVCQPCTSDLECPVDRPTCVRTSACSGSISEGHCHTAECRT